MKRSELITSLVKDHGGKIVFLVLDGLGGLEVGGLKGTALDIASTPNLDRLAREGSLGLSYPLGRGITPGSGPAHLTLFGYDPIEVPVGRGVLEALGIGMDVGPDDLAARGNFVTVDPEGLIVDRRAGRISTEAAIPLVRRLQAIEVDGVKTTVEAVKEHRFMLRLSGSNLSDAVADTDPQQTGVKPLAPRGLSAAGERTAHLIAEWLEGASEALSDQEDANMVTLRGFGKDPGIQNFAERYRLNAACVAVYPMYKGVSQLVGMNVLPTENATTPFEEFDLVRSAWNDFDFFFVHIKATDSRGEDGDIIGKAEVISSVDRALPALLKLNPEVLVVTGDHSTPARMKSHSWHPVPTMIWAPMTHRCDGATQFSERAAEMGGLGHFDAMELMALTLAHAGRLKKFGA